MTPERPQSYFKDSHLAVAQKIWPSSLGIGGAERATQRFVEAISSTGEVPIKVLTCGDFYRGVPAPLDYELPDWDKTKYFEVISIPSMPKIREFIVKNDKDIGVLQIGWGFEHYPHDLSDILDLHIPTILRTCEIDHFTQLQQELSDTERDEFRKMLLQKIDRIVAISTPLAREAINFGFRPDQVSIIRSTVSTEIFHPVDDVEKRSLRDRYGFSSDSTLFLFAGRLVEAKGIDLLLKSWNTIQEMDTQNQLHLVVIGGLTSGDPATPLVQNVIDHPLPNMEYRGVISDQKMVADYYKLADYFVYPSFHQEGLSVSVAEAMTSGLPVITSQWAATKTGMSDLLIPGITGITFEDRSSESLTSAIVTAVADPFESKQIGHQAREHVLRLGIDDTVAAKKYTDVYAQLLSEQR